MVRLILLFDICCSLCFILRFRFKRYWYVTSNLDHPLRRVAVKSSGAFKVRSGAITLRYDALWRYATGNLLKLRRFGTKSDGEIKLIFVVYKVKQCDLAVWHQ